MKHWIAPWIVLALASFTHGAHADECRPPAPGSWRSAKVVALQDNGEARLDSARRLAGESRRAAAAEAEAMFREIDQELSRSGREGPSASETASPCLPITVVTLAESLELQGKYLEAVAQYQRLLDARASLEKQRFWAEALARAEKGLPAALKQTASVTLHVHGRDCAVGAVHARFDDGALGEGAPLRVNPGEHAVRVQALGCKVWTRSFSAPSGTQLPIDVDLQALPPPPPPAPDTKILGLPRWLVVSGGVAIAVIGVGVTSYLLLKPTPEGTTAFDCNGTGATTGCTQLR